MIAALSLLAALLCLLASGFYSGSEMGFYCASRIRARLRAERESSPGARSLIRLVKNPQETVLGILLGTNLANYLMTVSAAALLAQGMGVPPHRVEFYTAAILSPLIFVVGDVVPKNWFQIESDRLMYRSAPVLRASVLAFRWCGALPLLHGLIRVLSRLLGQSGREEWAGPRGEVIGLLREGAAQGALTEEQADIVDRVMNLSNVRVGAIMVPRRLVVSLPVDADRAVFERIVRRYEFSRLPVLARDRRQVVGIVNVHDVLADESRAGLGAWMKPPLRIRARDSAASALVQLRRAHATMAVVTDPRRGFVGILTLKDVVEEVFGELPAW
jgi:CBS domain containing-hemolysin-like protein